MKNVFPGCNSMKLVQAVKNRLVGKHHQRRYWSVFQKYLELANHLIGGQTGSGLCNALWQTRKRYRKLKTLHCGVILFLGNQDRSLSPEMISRLEADKQAVFHQPAICYFVPARLHIVYNFLITRNDPLDQ